MLVLHINTNIREVLMSRNRWKSFAVTLFLIAACGDDSAAVDGGRDAQAMTDTRAGDATGRSDVRSDDTGSEADAGASAFVVQGVSGEDVLLDRMWDRGCVPGTNGNDWTQASRTLIGLELTFTLVDFQNGSTDPNCDDGRVGNATFTVQLTDDEALIPIIWVDSTGVPADAPAGLEAVTEANGATGLMSAAAITPETAERAAQLNAAEFCGATDWNAGDSRDAVECLTGGFNPFKATIIVDDRTTPWLIYDGVGMMFNAEGYPIDLPNYLPHAGPFEL